MALPYIGSTIRSKTPVTLKETKNPKTFKYKLKEHYLKELKISNSALLFLALVVVTYLLTYLLTD